MAVKIDIPTEYWKGLKKIAAITESQFSELVEQLREVTPTFSASELTSQIIPKLPHLHVGDVEKIIKTLVVLYLARVDSGLSTDELVASIATELSNSGDITFSDEERNRMESRLKTLLNIEEAIGVTARANDILMDHAHTFCEARIMTDIRPIFKADVGETPPTVVLVHTLKLSYHQGKRHQEIFIAMDGKDIQAMQRVLERAVRKSDSIKALLTSAGIRYLDVEQVSDYGDE